VARKASGNEHDALGEATGFDSDLGRIELMLQDALAASPLAAEAPNVEEVNDLLVRMRKERFREVSRSHSTRVPVFPYWV
jgi:hypothetical protein